MIRVTCFFLVFFFCEFLCALKLRLALRASTLRQILNIIISCSNNCQFLSHFSSQYSILFNVAHKLYSFLCQTKKYSNSLFSFGCKMPAAKYESYDTQMFKSGKLSYHENKASDMETKTGFSKQLTKELNWLLH